VVGVSGPAGRFLVAPFGDGAVVLDLETGTLSRVRGAAVTICEGLAEGESAEAVARRLVGETGIPLERARADVEAVQSQIAAAPALTAGAGPVSFERASGGFEMRYDGRPVLLLDPGGREAAMRGDPTAMPGPQWRLRLALPYLLLLRQQPVLHASAVQRGEAVLAISGGSGAGKSTLAGLLAGEAPVSDDLTLLRLGAAGPVVILNGEAAGRRWTASAAAALVAGGTARLSAEDLEEIASGPTLPLDEMWFLDADSRSGDDLALERADGTDAFLLLLVNTLGHLAAPGLWRRLFAQCQALAARVELSRARVPATLAALRVAAARYRLKVAS
jgi:hypothetical protein